MITDKQIAAWRALRNQGMTSAVGEYTPSEFWLALSEIERLRPDAELCRRIIDELVRQNNGMTPGWLLELGPNKA